MIRTVIRCLTAGQSKIAITVVPCNPVANLYRRLVDNAIKNSPKTDSASENAKRLVPGTMTLLELSKKAVAATNEDVLAQ